MNERLTLATVFLVAALIGLNFSILKFALEESSPFLVAGMRTVLASSTLLAFAFWRGERFPSHREDLFNIFVVGLSITTCSSALLVFGISKVSAGLGSLMSSTMPLFTAALSLVLLKVRLPRAALLGVAIGFGGTVVLAIPSLSGSSQFIGLVSLAVSALCWAFGNVYMKWRDFSRVSPVMLVAVQLVFSAMMLVPFGLLVEGLDQTTWGWRLFLPLFYASVPANAVTFALLATVVRRATPTVAASTAYLIPLFGVLFGFAIRGETLGPVEVLGGTLVIFGVFIVVRTTTRSTRVRAA
ncbi:MAG: EamA family transporter [Acidimicrobiales bacterium]|nr:EamA family transporter [Acidimicrobiales bacterium]